MSGTVALWTGAAGNGLWSDAGNWQSGSIPTAGQDIEFDNLTGNNPPQVVKISQAVEVGSIQIDNTILQASTPVAPAITIEGNVNVGTSNYAAIMAPIHLTHNTTITGSVGTSTHYSDLLLCDPISDGGHGYGLTITGGGEVDIVPCNVVNGDASYLNGDVTEAYTGRTVVNDGSVFTVNAKLPAGLTVSGNGQVFGSGSAAALSTDGSEFGATDLFGFYPDALTVTGGAHFNTGSQFTDQLNGNTVGNGSADTGFSVLDVRGGVIDLGGATFQGTVDTQQYTPGPGDVITVIKNQTGHPIIGTFANLPEGDRLAINGTTFVISYRGGTSRRDVILSEPTTPTLQSVPAPATVAAKTATLSAVGADPASTEGVAGLTYTWSVISKPAGAKVPLIGGNGTNAAKTAAVRFYKAGTYHFRCTATNAVGNTATATVRMVVAQSADLIRLSNHAQRVPQGASMQYSGVVLDQFNHVIRSAAPITFSVESGMGAITQNGLFTADDQIRGHVVLLAEDDGVTGTVAATVG